MAIQARNKISTSFNMSSMTDIVFLLLIFFMVTSTQIAPNGLQVTLPQSSSQVKLIPHVSVSITKDMQYAVNKEPVDFANLEARLKQELAGQEEPAIVLRADKDAPTGATVGVMEIANRNRWKFTLATQP
ncbi:MAG: biopolymer transporter ExbD [Bacteroidales bacterium]|nr:biopolymer transporter ExbD [Bacteroidales bacterium]MBO7055876.1 biopolymer transporter ExbD [Bacteroidales bacterium]MBO7125135.1 biopolymer transporter ExbD [Bacteroidales bacterium]MBP5583345.1 biopolymer transporter ExbD [Bacteroidales bacterium]